MSSVFCLFPTGEFPIRVIMDLPQGCRSVECFKKLNKIEEGTYGIVYRAQDRDTGEVVALKQLKLEKEREGFPVTSLREISSLMTCKHQHIVNIREIVVGSRLDQVYIVMDFIEHDLRGLMDEMPSPFGLAQVKTLLKQLLSAIAAMHRHWFIHRDLKTSNLLLNNRGEIKVADFGLARRLGEPNAGKLTQMVVTLWYRAPELLLGETEYDWAVDIWSAGCIFAELLSGKPLFHGRSELDQLHKIYGVLGMPNERCWPGYSKLPHAAKIAPVANHLNHLNNIFPTLGKSGLDLIKSMLAYDPRARPTAAEAMAHPFFEEPPLPSPPELFPTWPSKATGERRRKHSSPSLPVHY